MDFLFVPAGDHPVTHGRVSKWDRDRVFRSLLQCDDPVAIRHGDCCDARVLANPRAREDGLPLNLSATRAFQTPVHGDVDPRGAPYEGVPLEVHYKFLRKTLYLWIPIPSGYSSGLTKKLREERPPYNDLAYVQIDSRKRDKAHTPPGKENEAERLRNNYLYLEWFYVRPQQFRGDSTSTERASLAGLGKKLLCAAIFLMVEKGFVTDPATAVIGLEAGGGHCEMSKDSKKRKALTMSDEDLRKYLLQHKATNRYVEVTTKKMKTEEDKAKFRRTTVCEIEDNRELAGYYRHQYGFEIFDDSNGLGFLMEAPLMTVIGNCGDTYRRPDALPDLTAAHSLPATRTTRSASRRPRPLGRRRRCRCRRRPRGR
eukprot:jgi/Mesvir1/9964/Mv05756-RA.1